MLHETQMRNYNFDIMKFILSIFVILIHAEVDVGVFLPFLRTAVPLFFITSSYFFFRKIQSSSDHKKILLNFLKRNMILYGFWFVILLPITLMIRDWFSGNVVLGVLKFFQSFFFNSTFRASWYLMALNIGMCISLFLAQKLTARAQVLVTLPFYLLCCLFTNYYEVAELSDNLMIGYDAWISIFHSLANSFPVSVFWLALGRAFAEKKTGSPKFRGILFGVLSTLLMLEHLMVSLAGFQRGNDCYVMLIGVCYLIFDWIVHTKPVDLQERCGLLRFIVARLGNISTVIYVSHASVITVLPFIIKNVMKAALAVKGWFLFFITIIVCLSICVLLFVLERVKPFRWLKYSH